MLEELAAADSGSVGVSHRDLLDATPPGDRNDEARTCPWLWFSAVGDATVNVWHVASSA
jgi:hypothetical protein